jgi:RHS repeat-associated protein
MRELRAAQNKAAAGFRERDDLMTAWALSNSLSRQDMALATGLAKSRVDQIIRETYDSNSRISKGAGIAYKYDAGNSPTTIGTTTNTYDAASELEKSEVSKVTTAKYSSSEVGDRTKYTPATGPAVTYVYDQAGALTSVTRPKEGATPAIEDAYGYNGDSLRTSQTISGATTYTAWDLAEPTPLLLNDGLRSYIYGPGGYPAEQINSEEHPTYVHHDQQGSSRALTSSTGTVEATMTYDAFGNKTGSTGAGTTSLGYDGEYTDGDTGLVYLRSRYYDPATAAFLTIDPSVESTLAPYTYAQDDPLSLSDPSGRCATASAAAYPTAGSSGKSQGECEDLKGKILSRVTDLKNRYEDLKKDFNKLKVADKLGHVQAFESRQRDLIKKVRKFSKSGCTDKYAIQLPAVVNYAISFRLRVRVTAG